MKHLFWNNNIAFFDLEAIGCYNSGWNSFKIGFEKEVTML